VFYFRLPSLLLLSSVVLLAQDPPTIRVPVRLVVAPTSVTDRQGRFVNGLRLSDFTLYDNDARQIIHQDFDFEPISVAIAVQTNLEVKAVRSKVHELGPLLGTLVVGEGGEAAVLTFDKKVNVVQPFSGDRGLLTRTLNRVDFSQNKSHLVDATLGAIRLLKARPKERRRILLLIAESRDQGSDAKLRDAVAEAELNNVLIYSLDIPRKHAVKDTILPAADGAGGTALTIDIEGLIKEIYGEIKTAVVENPLSVLTRYSGGRQYDFGKEPALVDAVTKIGEELHGQYLLSYSPNNLDDGGYHRIRVDVNLPEVAIRTRPGYWNGAAPASAPALP
jgi:VWFA-related protein